MKELLEKASTYRFGNCSEGECFLMTMCLAKYMLEEGITLQSHISGIKRGKEYVLLFYGIHMKGKGLI